MSIWVTGSLEVRDSSNQLVFQVGDSSEGAPAKFSSLEVTGSFEVVSDPINANPILTASYGGDPDIPRVGIGVLDAPEVTLGVKGDLGLSDNNSDTRIAVVGTNAYVNVGQDTNNRGFMFWEGGQKRIRFGTKESGSTYFSSFIIKSGSADVQSNLTVGNKVTTGGNIIVGGDVQATGEIYVGGDAIRSSNNGTPIQWDTSDNVTIGGTIQINGNAINASDGGTPIQWDVDDEVTIGGDLVVNGGTIKGSTGNVYIESNQNLYLDLDADNNGNHELVVRAGNNGEIFNIAEDGNITTTGDISVTNNKSITGVSNVIVDYNTGAGTGNFLVKQNGTNAIVVDQSGVVQLTGDLKLDENRILASDGGIPISWDTSDNVLIYGDLQVRSNNIQGSLGSNAITIDDQDITVAGMLKVGGDSIQDSVGNEVITFDTSANTSVEGELLIAGNIVRDSSAASVMQFDGAGGVTLDGAVTFADTATRARLQRFVTDPFKMSLQVSNAANAIATSAGAYRRYLFSNLQGAADKNSTYWNFVRGHEVRNQSTTTDVDTALSEKWIPPSTSERFEQYNSMSWVVPADCVITTMVVTLFGEHKPKPRNLTGLQDSDIMISIARSTPATSYIDGGDAGTSYINGTAISGGGDLLIDFNAGTDIGNINPGDSIEIDLSGLQDMDTTLSAGTKLYMALRMNWQPTSGDNIFYEYSQTGDTTQVGSYVDTGYLSYQIILTGYYV